jgi:hypothetical protein
LFQQFPHNARSAAHATDDVVGQMRKLGYSWRRTGRAGDRNRIDLTERGSRVADAISATLGQLLARWTDEVGHDRIDTFIEVLHHFSTTPSAKVK